MKSYRWCLVLCCLFSATVGAQYRFDHWTAAQGLPHNNVMAMAQTRDGYLWVGTDEGLARFDGVRFTVFNTSNTPGFTSNRITALHADQRGALWIGTVDGGVLRHFDGQFTPQNDGLREKRIVRIDEDDAGAVWVYTPQAIARREGERFVLLTDVPNSPWQPFHPARAARLFDVQMGPWYVDDEGFHRLAHGRATTVRFPEPATTLGIYDCQENARGTLWLYTEKRGVYRYREGQLTWLGKLEGSPVTEDRSGALWMSPYSDYMLCRTGGRLYRFPLPLPPGGQIDVRYFYDREGTLWFYSVSYGLFRVRPQVITPVSWFQAPSYSLYQTRQGEIWLAPQLRYHRGQSALTAGRNKVLPYTQQLRHPNGLFTLYRDVVLRFGREVGAMYEDDNGDLLFGTQKGLVRFQQDRFTLEGAPPGLITVLTRDATGALWAGGNQGLWRREAGQWMRFTRADGLATEDITFILPRHEQGRVVGLWIGGNGGLTTFRDGRFAPVPLAGLPSDRLRDLREDADGTLWLGTLDGGLARLKDGKLTSYTTEHGLYDNGVFQILEDRFGYFWMGCSRGIYRVAKQDLHDLAAGHTSRLHCLSFNQADGMLVEQCNRGGQPGGLITADGKLWFPTQNGAAVVDPAAVPAESQPPPVALEACRLDSREVVFRAPDGRAVLRLEPGQDNLEIQYTGLHLLKAEQIRFRYRLLGLDNQWVEVGTRRTAYFSRLPAGEYTFQVSAANSDGVWNVEGASLQLTVIAPVYRRWWFVTLAAFALVALGTAGYQYRVRGLERARAAQEHFSRRLIESQEHERQRIAAELHDSLGQNLMIIKNRAQLGSLKATPHPPSQEQFTEISAAVGQAIDEVREISYNLRPYHLDRLGLTQTIEAMIERVAAASGIDFTIEVPPLEGLFAPEAEINLYRVLQEAVNNIARHSQATAARVTITRETLQIIVTIQDNGRGFTNAEFGMRNAELKSAATPKSKIQNPKSGGFGLTGMAERVRLLGGTRTIESAPGNGTTVTIQIPFLP